ncbi:MFS transporter [Cohaesibacter gelatinilyticus]|uniref:Predicted arabinose efflux permease, MFS family n=1 Tax=Cohaesibacter gelatinilyticus TaxID=372072 RepID=A0A285PCZ9_9HYPH|nr:MFS transporter [Cohaesibacter gelatinilyticus]SNZ19107.1 Predicted arabinose efflux permease, MFS family [Cohaesibacter gelatinilyticus]
MTNTTDTVMVPKDPIRPDISTTAPARLATRLAFFAAGFAMACCAPLFPFFKENVAADKAQFGALLLCLGLGSLIAMPATGMIAARRGARPLILTGGYGLVVLLPLMALAQSPMALGAALLVFGAFLGAIDVAMNVHGAEVEALEKRPLMSNFHAHWSIGGFCGAGLMTLLLSLSVPVLACACIGAATALIAMLIARPCFLNVTGKEPEPFVMPRGIVLLLAALTCIIFLVEGAVLDWGALLIIDRDLSSPKNAGTGYILFSIAMLIGRLTGDRLIAKAGEFATLVCGGLIAMTGLGVILLSSNLIVALSGFVLIGLGAANLVPILFSAAGRQNLMPPGIAIAAVTTTGYAGLLMGPAIIGFLSDILSLSIAFWLLALLTMIVPLSARWVVSQKNRD